MNALPSFHDDNILSIEKRGDDEIWVLTTSEGGERKYLCFQGVERFLCNNFLEGNIIFEVQKIEPSEVNTKLLSRLFDMGEPSAQEYLEKIVSDATTSKLVLVLVNPSYGCKISCICREVSASKL